ncbi:MAG: hypothetical protein Q9166_001598 [cf. Caloplaca sp. 2 TL-2023]
MAVVFRSDIAADAGKRATFINSCKDFMAKYGFQGVDLDWEYPATPERGGIRADTANYVTLVKEMKAAFGTQYGLSLTLAPDYWYLRGFDAKAMEPHVDMFGFMAYDLHGFWDADLKTLGAIVRGQTDVREIYNDTLPLWFDDLDPKKINFGLAYYGRGYTLANPSCNQLECPFVGPSQPGPCSHYAGVLSLAEIKGYIRDKGLKPQLIEKSMMKQITWDDQWIGYDDEETTAMKKKWASGYCFGGTMIWSIDFKSGGGSNSDNPNELAPVTKDGSCGKDHGNTVCGDWPDGGDTVAEVPPSAATVANLDLVWEALRPPTAPAVLFMEVQSAAHGPKVPVARPADTVGTRKSIAARAAYLVLATTQPSRTDLPATSTSTQASGPALTQPSPVFLRVSTFFLL